MNEKIYKNKEEWEGKKPVEEDNIKEACAVCGEPHGNPCLAAGPIVRIRITMNEADGEAGEIGTGEPAIDPEKVAEEEAAALKASLQVVGKAGAAQRKEIEKIAKQEAERAGIPQYAQALFDAMLVALNPVSAVQIKESKIKVRINEEVSLAAFHGWKMKSTQMRVKPQCETPPNDNQWDTDEEGCPQFTNDKGIGLSHEDVIEAVEFINNVKPKKLIAYSRGGAMMVAALNKGIKFKPEITFVAAAWKRGWVSGLNPSIGNVGVIIHGTRDAAVPLRQSFELANSTGMKLFVFPGYSHVNILKFKTSPTSGLPVSSEILAQGLKELPDWGEGKSNKEMLASQMEVSKKIFNL